MSLVTIDQAKGHLRVTDDASNADIELKLEQASDIVIHYLKSQANAGWSDGSVTVPSNLQAATLFILEDLYEHRPIDWTVIERLLVSYRDPALA